MRSDPCMRWHTSSSPHLLGTDLAAPPAGERRRRQCTDRMTPMAGPISVQTLGDGPSLYKCQKLWSDEYKNYQHAPANAMEALNGPKSMGEDDAALKTPCSNSTNENTNPPRLYLLERMNAVRS